MKHIVKQRIEKGEYAGKTLRAEMGWEFTKQGWYLQIIDEEIEKKIQDAQNANMDVSDLCKDLYVFNHLDYATPYRRYTSGYIREMEWAGFVIPPSMLASIESWIPGLNCFDRTIVHYEDKPVDTVI